MSGDPLYALQGVTLGELVRRAGAVRDKHNKLVALRDQLSEDLASKEREVQDLESEIEVLNLVVELFRVLMDHLVEKQVGVVESLSTKGLQKVFPDLDLSLEAEVLPKYNKISIEFFLRRGAKTSPYSIRGRPLEAFGGGPSSIVSLILRIITITKLKLAPILVLDESLVAVSDDYIDLTSHFLRALTAKLGFDIILVTHKTAFLEHADDAYRCSEEVEDNGASTHLVLRRAS